MILGDGHARRFRITIRLSFAERQAVAEAADRAGITRSAYARHALLNVKPPGTARKPSVDASMLVCLLDRLGTIASTLRALSATFEVQSGLVLPSIERELSRSLLDLRSLRPQLLEALGKRPAR